MTRQRAIGQVRALGLKIDICQACPTTMLISQLAFFAESKPAPLAVRRHFHGYKHRTRCLHFAHVSHKPRELHFLQLSRVQAVTLEHRWSESYNEPFHQLVVRLVRLLMGSSLPSFLIWARADQQTIIKQEPPDTSMFFWKHPTDPSRIQVKKPCSATAVFMHTSHSSYWYDVRVT